ncbi:hypothetical protein L5515_015177 [Caenorhabditis briggsae]|uniref:Uncharacterized protein n=1 Tax=Caenorhabditis briggsae TaxID=6238 RepID=A0AAE9J8Y9_CAEBR|nr:hypothetical protein L5515_015177 [Caenorhabditis briggsae]
MDVVGMHQNHEEDNENESLESTKEWILKQEQNDEILYENIKKLEKSLLNHQQKVESDKIEQKSTLKSLFSEMRQNLSEDFKNFQTGMLTEIRDFRDDVKLKSSKSESVVARKSESSDTDSGTSEHGDEVDSVRKVIKVPAIDNGILLRDNYRCSIEKLERSSAGFREEISAINHAFVYFRDELEALKCEQNERIEAMDKAHKEEMEALRQELLTKIDNANKKDEIPKLMEQPVQKPQKIPKEMPIRFAIVGDWKLVTSKNLTEFYAKNHSHKHEVHSVNMRFRLVENKLTSYFSNGKDYQKLKCKCIGTADSAKNHWRIEGNQIKSIDFNGFSKETNVTEKCVRYMENGQLVVINEMGGVVCTRIYEKIKQ